jgi:hypothetical protein
MTPLKEFLAELALNSDLIAAMICDPKRTLDSAKLNAKTKRILMSRSPGVLLQALRGEEVSEESLPKEVAWPPSNSGSLVVVGTGIRSVGQLTAEAVAHMKAASKVFYLVSEPVSEFIIQALHPSDSHSLYVHYNEGGNRKDSYEAMVGQILSAVRDGHRTCAVFYGHPGVFAFPSHESIRRARAEGFDAKMLPAISAEDCLFADLGVDPALTGCQSYEATDFLLNDKVIDTTSQLILWQIGVVGDVTFRRNGFHLGECLTLLQSRLTSLYGPTHQAYVYEAAILPGLPPRILQVPLCGLSPSNVNACSTLYIPPARGAKPNAKVLAAITRSSKISQPLDSPVPLESSHVAKAKQLLAAGGSYAGGCSEFMAKVLAVPAETANSMMGESPTYIGNSNDYPGLVPGDVVGWKVNGGNGHVSLFVGETGMKFIDVRSPGDSPRKVVNGYGAGRPLFKSSKY